MFNPKTKFSLFVLALAVALLSACKKEDKKDDPKPPDTTKPTIQVSSPANKSKIAAGEVLRLALVVTDDRELGELKVDIHDAFDGHSHGKTGSVAFAFEKILRLSGQRQEIVENIPIPADALAGPYHLIVRATDRAGNQADFVEVDFEITSPSQPVINNLRINGKSGDHIHVHFHANETQTDVRVEAELSDNDGLRKVELKVKKHDHVHKRADHGQDEVLHKWEQELGGATTHNLNHTFQALRAWLGDQADKELEVEVKVFDVKGHLSIRKVEIHLEKE